MFLEITFVAKIYSKLSVAVFDVVDSTNKVP